jgi:caa(3)-type oxidase subunit IV
MTTTDSHHPGYVTIWAWLVALLAAGLLLAYVPIDKTTAIFLIAGIAVVKAFLVARHYMHLKSESFVIIAIAGIPLLLLVGLALALVPDVIFNR